MTPLGRVPQNHVVVTAAAIANTSPQQHFRRSGGDDSSSFTTGQTVPLLVHLVAQLGLRRQGLGMFAQFYTWFSVRLERGHRRITPRHDLLLDRV